MSTTTQIVTESAATCLSSETGTEEVIPQAIDLISKIHEIPEFSDKYAERKWAKEHMAAAFRIFAKFGYNDGAGGHISLRDPVNPKQFWISELFIELS